MRSPTLRLLVIFLCLAGRARSGKAARAGEDARLGDAEYPNNSGNVSEPCDADRSCDTLCFCDEHCKKFDDCCHASFLHQESEDVVSFSTSMENEGSQSDSASSGIFSTADYHVCVELPPSLLKKSKEVLFANEYTLPHGYWMVGTCPPSWYDGESRHLCEGPADESDLMLLLPVVSSDDTMTSFRNIYCALCHGIPLTKLTSWTIETQVELGSSSGVANRSADTLAVLEAWESFDIRHTKFSYPSAKSRVCFGHVVDDCPAGYESEHVIRACRSYMTAMVQLSSNVTYRNWYCALCNGAIQAEPESCQKFWLIPTKQFTTALTALVDFRGISISLETTGREIESTCDRNEFLDPFTLRCRPLLCLGGVGPVNGECVRPSLPRKPPEITHDDCVRPGYVDLEVDMCLTEDPSSDPCALWGECFGLQNSRGRCEAQAEDELDGGLEGGRSCDHLTRIHITVNTTALVIDDTLMGKLAGNLKDCPTIASVPKVVVKSGCIPPSSAKCRYYHSHNGSRVYLTSWNQTGTVYLRDLNNLFLLEETLYQITYKMSKEGPFNRTESVIVCGDPVDFNCSLVRVNSSSFSQLLAVDNEPLTVDNHVILETGGALVCRHLVLTPSSEHGGLSSNAIHVVTLIGLIISMLSLVASFVTYVMFPTIRNLPGRCVMSLIAAVFSAQLMLLITGDDVARSVSGASCFFLAVFLHYACLSTFSWSNVLVLYLARTLGPGAKPSAARQHRNSFLYFSLFGWGAPLAVVLICVVLHFIPDMGITYGASVAHGGIRSCSITKRDVEIAAFVVPISVSLLANVVLFLIILAGFTLRRAPSGNLYSKEARTSRVRRDALVSVKIGFLLAFSWIFGFLATAFESEVLLYVFCILTSLQGVYIFLAFTFTQQVRALWREKLGLKRPEPTAKKTAPRKYFQKPRKAVSSTADKKDLCRKHSPSEHQTADTAHTGMAKDADIV